MRILRKPFWMFVILLAIFIIVGYALPDRFEIEHSIDVAAKPAAVFGHVGDLKAWQDWASWFRHNPAPQMTYSKVTNRVGAWSRWSSKTEGSGKMTISEMRAPLRLEYRMDLELLGGLTMRPTGTVELAPEGGGTRVTMTMAGELGSNPVSHWFGVFVDDMVGPDFDKGLENLKAVCEADPSAPGARK